MSFGFMGCNPKQIWPATPAVGEPKPPPYGTRGQAKGKTYILLQAGENLGRRALVVVQSSHFEANQTQMPNNSGALVALVENETGDVPSGSRFWGLIEGCDVEVRVRPNASDVSPGGGPFTVHNSGALINSGGNTTNKINGIFLRAKTNGSTFELCDLWNPKGVCE